MYNIGDIVFSYGEKFLIVGKHNNYIVLPMKDGVWGWQITLEDCKTYNINSSYLGKKARYLNDESIEEKNNTLECWYCKQKFIYLNDEHDFFCWSCKIQHI